MEKIYTQEQLKKFETGWADFMIKIFRERMTALQIYDTGRLMASLSQEVTAKTITHKFMLYGIYVAAGTGLGYEHDNGGDIQFLDPEYRYEQGLNKKRKKGPAWGGGYTSGKPRKRRDWFNLKYYYSVRRLNEKEAAFYGEAYQGYLIKALAEMMGSDGKVTKQEVKNVLQR